MTIRPMLFAAALAACGSAQAQQAIPRTPQGRPDFQGVWLSVFTTPMERPPGTALVVSEAEARTMGQAAAQRLYDRGAGYDPNAGATGANMLMKVHGEYRTSLIVQPADGQLPVTETARASIAAARTRTAALPDDPEFRPEMERCISSNGGRAPLALNPGQNARQIIQTRQQFVIYTDEGADLRVINMGGRHRPAALSMWEGDSIAQWKGDELEVETTHARGVVSVGPYYGFVMRPESRVIEQFRLTSPDEILYSYTIVDPDLYSQPWRVEFVLTRTRGAAYEYACHEGNYALLNMLRAARSVDRRAVMAGKTAPPR